MDQKIFAQLDKLESGARRESHRPNQACNDSSMEYPAYDGYVRGYVQEDDVARTYQHGTDDFVEQPMVLDSFDEHLLRQPDHNSRHGQAALGRARFSLMPNNTLPHDLNAPDLHREPPRPRSLNLSHFAFPGGHAGPSSSSPIDQPLPSSPAFNASQRRPPPYELGRDSHQQIQHHSLTHYEQPSTFQPYSVDELEGESRLNEAPLQTLANFTPNYGGNQLVSTSKQTEVRPQVVRGIELLWTHVLPDRFRAIFPFPAFNAVQSKCFATIYKTNNNFVLSAPTGSGKTALLELAICRLISGFSNGSFKIVYQAPTKSLCAERQRDWQAKFGPLDLQCAELTGDTEMAQLRNVQHATIIITTPEKWDSMTRKWKDHQKLMQMVKLFLIDEVHILKEDRGATLEAVVSRMKSIGSDVRFIALSATVPNSQDVATWLGKDPMNPDIPATREKFGEDFRPVPLQKHVCGYQSTGNDFAFDKVLNGKLPEVISRYSKRKPIMVFCFTRSACVETAKLLANWWATKGPKDRYWNAPQHRIVVGEKDLRDTISSGVAFHHAGLTLEDRNAVERGYLQGEINVICCTSTLAVGVNLPCHMVIIKNTVTYQSNQTGGTKEYSDLEIMQMLGRAGRPQFDDNAVAVIMTRLPRVQHYEKMITGQEVLESCLHRNLIDHLNAEIGLGTVTNASSAKKWLSGTFLYVRLMENPGHYKLDGDAPGRDLDERLENICRKGIAMLEEHDLVTSTPKVHCTEFGDVMARYYLRFDTMKIMMAIPPKAKVSEILSAVAQAAEFKDIRFRAGEKPTYKALNKNSSIKFPIPVNIDLPAHKVSLVIQAVLGAIELPTEDYKHKTEFMANKLLIFQHVQRLIRCIVDCQLYLDDAVSTRNALMLARSFGAQVWDDSPLHIKQLEGVGLVAVRKLAVAGIKSIEDIETVEAHRLEGIMSRHPPYGAELQEKARAFPKPIVSLKMMGEPMIKKGECVTVKVKAELGFLNDKTPESFQKRPVYVCLLAETSDGQKVQFARTSAKRLNRGQDILFSANLTNPSQFIRAYVMCDEIAGTSRQALLKPEIPAIAFPPPKPAEDMNKQKSQFAHAPNTSKRRASASKARVNSNGGSDEFGDAGLDDADLALAEGGGFVDIDDLDEKGNGAGPKQKKQKTRLNSHANDDWEPQQLANGKWACNHACKDKTACKHMCCRDGLDKKPKPPKQKEDKKKAAEPGSDPKQTQLNMGQTKKTPSTAAAPSNQKSQALVSRKADESREMRDLNRLHDTITKSTPNVPVLGKRDLGAENAKSRSGQPRLSFLDSGHNQDKSSDYGQDGFDPDDLRMSGGLGSIEPASHMSPPRDPTGFGDFDDDMLDAEFGEPTGTQPYDDAAGDGRVDLSSYTDDLGPRQDDGGDWQLHQPFDSKAYDLGVDVPEMTQKGKSSSDVFAIDQGKSQGKEKALFVGYSTDSASEHYLPEASREQHTLRQRDVGPGVSSSRHFTAQQPLRAASRTRHTQPAQDYDEALPTGHSILDNAFLADAVGNEAHGGLAREEHPNSTDELESWFKAEFGTEQFHWVG